MGIPLSAPGKRSRLVWIAVAATLLVHGAAASALWILSNNPRVPQPPQPLEIALVTPTQAPPLPMATPAPPPPLSEPPPPLPEPPPPEPEPPPPEPEDTPPPEPEPLPPEPPPPEPEPIPEPEPEPPPPEPEPMPEPVVQPEPLPELPPPPRQVVERPVSKPEMVEPVRQPEPPPVAALQPRQASPAPALEEALVDPIFDAAYLRNPPPRYPTSARRLGIEGTAVVRVLVGRQGEPQQVKIVQSAGAQVLDEAALDAVRSWSFVPAKRGSRTITATVDVPIRFHLN